MGLPWLDDRISGGVAPGEVLLLLCHSGVGKTWFAVNVARNNPTIPTVMFSLEMHGRYILKRLAGAHTNTPTGQIESTLTRRGRSDAVDDTIKDFPLFRIVDDPELGFGDMQDYLDEYEAEAGERPRLVLIDYLELITSFDGGGAERVDGLARAAKRFARAADVSLVLLHQVRQSEVKVPTTDAKGQTRIRTVPNEGQAPLSTHDSRYGGNVQADYVVGMYRPSLDPDLAPGDAAYIEHDIRFQLLKTRTDGGTHRAGVQHHWNPQTGRISHIGATEPVRWGEPVDDDQQEEPLPVARLI